jgi:arylsulfatase A-like enzyme
MTSKSQVVSITVVAALLVVAGVTYWSGTKSARNVIVLSVDTLSVSALKAFNPAAAELANLDDFSGESLRFVNAYSPASWTLPAHGSLLSGLYPDRHGAVDPRTKISSRVTTLAMYLNEAGFETVAFTDGAYVDYEYGFNAGFDRYDDWVADPEWRINLTLPRDGKRDPVSGANLFDRAIAYLSDHQTGQLPFFLFLHTYAVHDYFIVRS